MLREVPTFGGMVEGFESGPPPPGGPKKRPGWKRDTPPASEVDEGIQAGVRTPEEHLQKQIDKDVEELASKS